MNRPIDKGRWFLYVMISLCGGLIAGIIFYFLFPLPKNTKEEKERQI